MKPIAKAALAAALSGCFGQSLGPAGDDAGYGLAPDLVPACSGNHDAVIDRSELVFPTGTSVNYLINPPGTTVPVAPDGAPGADGLEWDLTSTAGDVHALLLDTVSDKWFASSFPSASYAVVSDLQTGILGIFQVTNDALLL